MGAASGQKNTVSGLIWGVTFLGHHPMESYKQVKVSLSGYKVNSGSLFGQSQIKPRQKLLDLSLGISYGMVSDLALQPFHTFSKDLIT